jgi:hypothetical protein
MTKRPIKLIRACQTCGKDFPITNSYLINKRPTLYCSHACSNKRNTINQSYFTPPLTPDKLITLGQMVATAHIQNDHTIIVRSDQTTIDDIQTKLNSTYPVSKSDNNKLKLKISSTQMVSDLSNYGIVHNPLYQEFIPYDILEGLLKTDCYKTKDGVQMFRTPSSKLSLEVARLVGGDIITETYKDVSKGVLACDYIVKFN